MTERLSYRVADNRSKALQVAPAAIGRAFAYVAVPASLTSGGATACIFVVAACGVVAFVRGAQVPPYLAPIAILFAVWCSVLVVLNNMGGASFADESPIAATRYLILLAFPFFVIGMREVGTESAVFEKLIALTVLFAAGQLAFQVFVLGVPPPPKLPGGPSSGGYALAVLCFSLFSLSRALQGPVPNFRGVAIALAGLGAVALADVRLVWACAVVGYATVFFMWAISRRCWIIVAVAAVATAAFASGLFRLTFVGRRIGELIVAFQNAAAGDSTGTVGIRYGELATGWQAFLKAPLLGHGLVDIHNDYLGHLVAFGVLGPLFVISFLAVFLMTTHRSPDPSVWRFGFSMTVVLALYMTAATLLGDPETYGFIYLFLGFFLAAPEPSPVQAAVVATLPERSQGGWQ